MTVIVKAIRWGIGLGTLIVIQKDWLKVRHLVIPKETPMAILRGTPKGFLKGWLKVTWTGILRGLHLGWTMVRPKAIPKG